MARFRYFLLYKPFGVVSQFTAPVAGKRTLGELHDFPKDVYPVGRLDEDSEGLLILTNDPSINARYLGQGIEKEYYAQVEGVPESRALDQLRKGVTIRVRKKDHHTLPAQARLLEPAPDLPPRDPPIRFRKTVPDSWISLSIREGKNRQVRKMTAKVGHPCLRLVRVRLGKIELGNLEVGEVKEVTKLP